MFINKNYTYTKLICLKFNSELNEPKTGWYAVKQKKQTTNHYLLSAFIVWMIEFYGILFGDNIFKQGRVHFLTQRNGFMYFYLTQIILFTINNLFAHS